MSGRQKIFLLKSQMHLREKYKSMGYEVVERTPISNNPLAQGIADVLAGKTTFEKLADDIEN